jgi:hypothetical protein
MRPDYQTELTGYQKHCGFCSWSGLAREGFPINFVIHGLASSYT